MLTRLRAGASLAGEWVFQGATPSSAPMLGDRIVGDTLFLRPDLSGTWSITQVDPLDATQRRRSAITLRWESRNDSLWVIPTCEPRELCDPIPPWVGTLTANGTLGLVPAFATGHVYAVRDYRRED